MTDPELLIGIGGRAEDLLLSQLTGDLARPAAGGAHGKDPADNGGGFLVHNQLFAVVLILFVTIGSPGSKTFPAFRFGTENGPNLAAGVPNIPFVGDVADVCVGVVIKPTQYYTDDGIPAFRSLNIGEMYVKDSDWVYFTQEGHQKNQKSAIRKNDVLVVRSGAPGTACVANDKYAGYNAVDIIIAHPDSAKINSTFLAMFTNLPHGMNQIKGKTGGAAQQHFNVSGYKSLKLMLPPLDYQNEFASFVVQTDRLRLTIQQSLDKLEVLKKSLMQEYFG